MSNTPTVNTKSMSEVTSLIDLGPTGSLQFQFAKLQLAMSMICKEGALEYIDQIQETQDQQKQLLNMLQTARQLKADADNGKYNGTKASDGKTKIPDDCSEMPAEMVKYMDKYGLAYDKEDNDNFHDKDEWDVAIQSLQAKLDNIGSETQQLMVFVQDYMGQYNSYLQGTNSVIQQANQTLGELAKAR
jgi:hypothetical protein